MGHQIRAGHSSVVALTPPPPKAADFDAQLCQIETFRYVSSLYQNPYFSLLYHPSSNVCRCYVCYVIPKVTNSWREFDAQLCRNKAFTNVKFVTSKSVFWSPPPSVKDCFLFRSILCTCSIWMFPSSDLEVTIPTV
jgi:hypothetical protein